MRTDWILIGVLYAAGLLAAAQFAKIALTLGALEDVFPGMPLPFAVSALSVVGILFGVTAGIVVARLGARRVILWALAGSAIISALQSLLPPFPVFMALRVAEGVGHLALVVASPTLMSAIARPSDVPIAMGLWGTFFGVGFALSAVAVPVLGTPSAVYLAHAAGMLLLMLALWPRLPRGLERATGGAEGFVARHVAIYRQPRIVAAALVFFWHTLVFLGLLTFLPGFIGAWTAPILPLAALTGTIGAGVAVRRFPPLSIAGAGFALTCFGMFVLLVLPDAARPFAVFPVFICAGIPAGACFATVPYLNADPADRARGNGAVAQIGNLGTFGSIPVFAATVSFGIAGLLTAAMVVSVAGLGTTLLIHRKIAQSP